MKSVISGLVVQIVSALSYCNRYRLEQEAIDRNAGIRRRLNLPPATDSERKTNRRVIGFIGIVGMFAGAAAVSNALFHDSSSELAIALSLVDIAAIFVLIAKC